MDIGNLFTKDTADVVITDPVSGKETDLVITVHSVVSDEYAKAFQRHQKRGKDAPKELLLADLTVGWKGAKLDGKDYKFSTENAVDLYRKSKVVRNQVDIELMKGSSFLLNA